MDREECVIVLDYCAILKNILVVVISMGANQNIYKVWFFPNWNSNQVEIQCTFNAQSQTSYPSCPSLKDPPRHSVVGGYVINNATCVTWGSCIIMRPLHPEIWNDSIAAFCIIMQKVEAKPYHAFFTMFGPDSYKQYMVMTQSVPFCRWKGMDPELIPRFEEGKCEAVARELLEAEGGFTYDIIYHNILLVMELGFCCMAMVLIMSSHKLDQSSSWLLAANWLPKSWSRSQILESRFGFGYLGNDSWSVSLDHCRGQQTYIVHM